MFFEPKGSLTVPGVGPSPPPLPYLLPPRCCCTRRELQRYQFSDDAFEICVVCQLGEAVTREQVGAGRSAATSCGGECECCVRVFKMEHLGD